MALRKELLKVKLGEKFIFTGESSCFTIGRTYSIESIDYNNGTSTTYVEVIDNDNDMHLMSDTFLINNFKK